MLAALFPHSIIIDLTLNILKIISQVFMQFQEQQACVSYWLSHTCLAPFIY